ncbi:MAG: endopeptidase La [Ignavibacteria bacterium]|nr:endopeptidase La [Ignavibacteria bacterium]
MPRKKARQDKTDRQEASEPEGHQTVVNIPETLPVIPLRNSVFFPRQIFPLAIGREASLLVIQEAQKENTNVLILTQQESAVDKPKQEDLYRVGTVAKVLKAFNLPDGSKNVLLQGLYRARVLTFLQFEPTIRAAAQRIEDERVSGIEVDALVTTVKTVFQRLVELSNDLTDEHLSIVFNTEEPGAVADSAASFAGITVREKQMVLEILNVKERLSKVHFLLSQIVERLELGAKIKSDVQEEISKTQREYYLREQLKAIQKELGDGADNVEVKEFRKRMEKANPPEDVRKTIEKEIERLGKMNSASAEYTVARTYIEWLLELPWSMSTEDNLDIAKAREVLENDHYGLEKVKKRILEYLAVRKLKEGMRGPILCFVGPPGVGKTSLGRSIANALGRKFVRMSLGGVHDEAEIRGHRRTYIGALPGRIIQGIKKAGSNNPVFMLDEVDKIGMDFRGDPASALLEVLDPEQNSTFSDHYVELPFDLSKVLFIATGNLLDPIPAALRDRMEIIEIPSYVEEEKLHIAKDFLIPKQRKEHGLTEGMIAFDDDALRKIVTGYTREAGVRSLERRIADVCRGVAREVVEGKRELTEVKAEILTKYLGQQRFFPDVAERLNKPGIATGLAWTPVGGDILFIEATKMKGKGNLILTGQLGDVMKESAQAALSYISAQASQLGIEETFREQYDIHIHVPAGATPKDGPSAGVTMLTALASLLTARLVRNDLAMTGEITLRGAVLPIGGVKEKVLAAHRAGLRWVLMPERNKPDLEEIPAHVRESMQFHFVKEMEEVLQFALQQREEVSPATRREPTSEVALRN